MSPLFLRLLNVTEIPKMGQNNKLKHFIWQNTEDEITGKLWRGDALGSTLTDSLNGAEVWERIPAATGHRPMGAIVGWCKGDEGGNCWGV